MAQGFDPDAYLKTKKMATVASNEFDPDAYLKNKTSKPSEPGMLRKGLGALATGLDYLGGLTRTGLAGSAGLIQGDPNKYVKEEDVYNAFKGNAPTSAEYLERAGLSEGPSVNLPFIGKTSLRDVEGFGLDIATDPLSLAAKGIRHGIVNPASRAMEKIGEKTYKSGLKKVDERLIEKGTAPVSDVLLAEGKTGSTAKLSKDAQEILSKSSAERAELYKKADDLGVSIDMGHPLKESEKIIAKLRKDPGLAPMADDLVDLMERYKAKGRVDMATLSEWKTNIYNSLPDSAYDNFGKTKGPAKEFQKALAKDFKTSIVEAGNKAEKGLGDKIDALNDKMGSLLDAGRPMRMQVRREMTPNALTSVDAILTGSGLLHSPQAALGMLALKKGADISKTTGFRTRTGKGLIDVGKSNIPDLLIRRELINQGRE